MRLQKDAVDLLEIAGFNSLGNGCGRAAFRCDGGRRGAGAPVLGEGDTVVAGWATVANQRMPRARRCDPRYTETAMTTAAKEIVDAALKLEPQTRAEVAEDILESLGTSSYGELSPAWEEEIARRVREIEEGSVQMIPAEQVFTEIEASLRARRANK